MSIVPFNCAVGDAKSITLAVASTVNVAPPDDSVDTNHVIIAGNGTINSFGFGPAGIPVTKEIWLHPSSGNITLVHSTTLQLLGLANHVTANPTYGKYYYDGLGTWRELSFQDATTTAGGGGPQGPAGPQGPQGAQGAQGPPGQTGSTGLTGPQGIQGPQGSQGQTGPQGSTGAAGPGYQATAPDYRNIAIGSTTFGIGIGYAYSAGVRARANPVQNIDYWMEGLVTSYNPSTGILTINVDSIIGAGQFTNWNVNLIGEIGQTGDVGATGVGGPPGPQGIQGVQGDVGPQGNTGSQGPIGPKGADSTVPGPQGPQGNTGSTGPTGPQGVAGPPGGLGEAPQDNNIYGRKNATWTLFSSTAVVIISDTVPPAPASGELWFDSVGSQMYVWFNDGTSSQWVPVVNQQGLPDAPSDGTLYVRGNNAWVHAAVPASTVPIIDGTATVGTATAYARSDHIHPTDTSRVAKAGDTLTGPLILAADPTAVKGAVTKQYADAGDLANTQLANTKLPLAGGTLTGNLTLNGMLGVGITVPANALANTAIVNSTLCTVNNIGFNAYVDSSPAWRAITTGISGAISINSSGTFSFFSNASVNAGALISLKQVASIDNAGNTTLGGTLSVGSTLSVSGQTNVNGGLAVPASAQFTHTLPAGTTIAQGGGTNFWVYQNNSNAQCPITFHISGVFACNFGMDAGGYFYCGGWSFGANAYRFWTTRDFANNPSDYRIKKNVESLPTMWQRIKTLNPVRYQNKNYTLPNGRSDSLVNDDGIEHWGFIAHELQNTLIQDAATGIKDQEDRIQYPHVMPIVAALTKALQEAMTRIEALEARQ